MLLQVRGSERPSNRPPNARQNADGVSVYICIFVELFRWYIFAYICGESLIKTPSRRYICVCLHLIGKSVFQTFRIIPDNLYHTPFCPVIFSVYCFNIKNNNNINYIINFHELADHETVPSFLEHVSKTKCLFVLNPASILIFSIIQLFNLPLLLTSTLGKTFWKLLQNFPLKMDLENWSFWACFIIMISCWYDIYTFKRHPGSRLNLKMLPFQYRNIRHKDKTILHPSYLYNGNPIPGKTVLILRLGPGCFVITHWHFTFSVMYSNLQRVSVFA